MILIEASQPGGGVPRYQLKITLKWSRPAIWRRVVVRADMRLDRLHDVIQIVMGWTNSHLHQFILGRSFYGEPDPEFADLGTQTLNEKRYTVADLAPAAKTKFIYEYDFGDGWQHEVKVEKVLPSLPISSIRFVSRAKTPARRRIAAASAAITICWKHWKTRNAAIMQI